MRSLIIGQLFKLVDVVLVVAFLGAAWLVLGGALRTGAATKSKTAQVSNPDTTPVSLPEPGPRSAYDVIVNSKLFGPEAQRTSASADEPAPAPKAAAKETTLPLRLLGTAAGAPKDPLATATIENQTSKTQTVYYLQDEIMPGVKLVEVYHRKVLLEHDRQPEWLTMDQDEDLTNPAMGAGMPNTSHHITVKKDELIGELTANYSDILHEINPQPHRNAAGKVDGYTSKNLSNVPLARKLGLRDNDVLKQINGVTINSEEKIVEVANRFRNSKTFRLTIERNGRPQVITYNVE